MGDVKKLNSSKINNTLRSARAQGCEVVVFEAQPKSAFNSYEYFLREFKGEIRSILRRGGEVKIKKVFFIDKEKKVFLYEIKKDGD